MADQLLSLDTLAKSVEGTAQTSLYTAEERARLNELVNMDVDLETAAEMYHEIASNFGWPSEDNEAGTEKVIPGREHPDDCYGYLEELVEAGSLDPMLIRGTLPEDFHEGWDKKHLEITNENYEETKKIQDAANRRRTDPEVQRFERFMGQVNAYAARYWEENQNKRIAATGPKSPLVLGVNFEVARTTENGVNKATIKAAASFRKKSIFSAS